LKCHSFTGVIAMIARLCLSSLVLALVAGVASADPKRPLRGPAQWRPCGPGDSSTGNKCAPQMYRGADMRPACETHDQCYANKSGTQKECDQRFLADMKRQCDLAGNPAGCYRRARVLYFLVRIAGADAYKNG
jgi:hypothetical protein